MKASIFGHWSDSSGGHNIALFIKGGCMGLHDSLREAVQSFVKVAADDVKNTISTFPPANYKPGTTVEIRPLTEQEVEELSFLLRPNIKSNPSTRK